MRTLGSIRELAAEISSLRLSPVKLFEVVADRIDHLDSLNCFITFDREHGMAQAEKAEAEIRSGRYKGTLHGIPIAVKDIFNTEGMRTTYGSAVFKDHVPNSDASAVSKLRSSGAVIIGKVNLHELAFGSTNENRYFGSCRNPWDPQCIAGGSSGGSATAVAAGFCLGSLGTDTGGSIRIPAALCGCVGLKPTYGRVSRSGISELSFSLDHVGPMARHVEDAAIILETISGFDSKDPASSKVALSPFVPDRHPSLSGLKIGVLEEFSDPAVSELQDDVDEAFRKSVSVLQSLGATLESIKTDWIKHARIPNLVIVHVEAAHSLWEKLRPRANMMSSEVRFLLGFGELLSGVDYLSSQRIRTVIIDRVRKLLSSYDALLCPTTPIVAPKIGKKKIRIGNRESDAGEILWRFTPIYNLTGLPAISLPCGFSKRGLPIGMQIGAKAFSESILLKIAHAYEKKAGWVEKSPDDCWPSLRS